MGCKLISGEDKSPSSMKSLAELGQGDSGKAVSVNWA